MSHSNVFLFEGESSWEDLGNGVQRKIFGYDEKLMLVKVKFEKGSVGVLHQHHHSQVTYVESGEFDMTIGDSTKRIKTGDGYYVIPDVVHGVVCIEPGMLIDVFSPQREDFFSK